MPLPQNNVKVVPVTVFGHKSLKQQSSKHKISTEIVNQMSQSPDKSMQQQQQNLSGLLNMSKQRAYTMDAEKSMNIQD